MRLLELFSGTGSVGSQFKRQFPNAVVVSIDLLPNPKNVTKHIMTDILTWNYKQYPPGYFDVVWASPPCTEYSKAKTTAPRDLGMADSLSKRVLTILNYLQPKVWFIENPGGGGLLDKRPFMRRYEGRKNRCTYCMYGTPYRKPTNIWSNVGGLRLKCCSCSGCGNQCAHKRIYGTHSHTAQRGNRGDQPGMKSAQNVQHIPQKLLKHLFAHVQS
jgi:hypothetical protein